MQLPRSTFRAVFFLSLLPLSADAADWTCFHGPRGTGVASGAKLPVSWDQQTNVAWKVQLPGQGWSSPVVWDENIYLTAAVEVGDEEEGYSLRALCLRGKDGSVSWSREIFSQSKDAPPIHKKNSHASPTPVIRDGRLYVHFGHQGTACLDLDGEVIWKNADLFYAPVHGNGGSPVVNGDKLFFSVDGSTEAYVIALSTETGEVVWKFERDVEAGAKFSFSTPLVIRVDGVEQLISTGSSVVHSLNVETGQVNWLVRHAGYSVIPKPVFGNGLVYVSTGYDSSSLLAIDPSGEGDVTDSHVKWSASRQIPHTPSVALVEDAIFMISDKGIASCLNALTGEVHWQQRVGGNYSASPIVNDGKVFFLSEEGEGIVVAAEKNFKKIATNALQERTLASYGVIDDALLIRTQTHLYRIEDRSTGSR